MTSPTVGRKLGHYELVELIGKGGMGEVYRARDTRLNRTVAIKVLPEHLSKDPALQERFEREARAVSSLNHPHICTLHDVGEHEGIHFLVMEHIEGETLSDRLKRGALPLAQAVDYAVQIADALACAHRAHIVHRDLKPGNVMLTSAGVKLLDFGLAKESGTEASDGGDSDPDAPTIQKPLTSSGTILGTIQYMAPEQLEGKEVDARADVFALGAILFEMVTGRKAFEGESQASLVSAVMSTEPPRLSELQSSAPPALERIVAQCLAKDPDRRRHSAHDLAEDLRWLTSTDEAVPQVAKRPSSLARRAIVGIGLVGLGFLVASLVPDEEPAEQHSYHLNLDVPRDVELPTRGLGLSLSPDGSTLIHTGRKDGVTQLWKRELTSFVSEPIPGTERARKGFFSPDGEWLGFFVDGALRKLRLRRGAREVVARTSFTSSTPSASWARDGYIYFSADVRGGLFRVSEDGGVIEQLTRPDFARNETGHADPSLLPDGKHVLFHALTVTGGRAAVLSLETRDWSYLSESETIRNANWVPPGYLLYFGEISGALMVAPFDTSRLELAGASSVLEENVLALGNSADYAVSLHGTLVYVPSGEREASLAWLDRRGEVTRTVERIATHPNVSVADGRVASDIRFADDLDIWIFDDRNTETRLTSGGNNDFPLWSSDGRYVLFRSLGGGRPNISVTRSDGVGGVQVLWEGDTHARPTSWSRDQRYVAIEAQAVETGRDVWVLTLERSANGDGFTAAGAPEPIHATLAAEGGPVFSPDGRWLAYVSTETGEGEVYVESFPEPEQRILVSNGGVEPKWSADGRSLYYRSGQLLMSVRILAEPTLRAEPPVAVFETTSGGSNTHAHYDVLGEDGFVMRSEQVPLDKQRIRVVTNLFERIRQVTTEP